LALKVADRMRNPFASSLGYSDAEWFMMRILGLNPRARGRAVGLWMVQLFELLSLAGEMFGRKAKLLMLTDLRLLVDVARAELHWDGPITELVLERAFEPLALWPMGEPNWPELMELIRQVKVHKPAIGRRAATFKDLQMAAAVARSPLAPPLPGYLPDTPLYEDEVPGGQDRAGGAAPPR
jgi:hypothetical protein